MDHERAYRGGYWIENAYPESYWAEFRAAGGRFARHIAEKGWTETNFEFYLNNKVYFKAERGSWSGCSAPWIFDEPVNTQDFWALRRFGREFLAATGGARNLVFRCDISRPEWQRDLLDGVCGEEVVSGALRPYRDRILARQARFGQTGCSSTAVRTRSARPISSARPGAWMPGAWARMASCRGTPSARPDRGPSRTRPACSIPPRGGPLPSLRLKAFCHGQQLVEYVVIFTQLAGHDRRVGRRGAPPGTGARRPLEEDLRGRCGHDEL